MSNEIVFPKCAQRLPKGQECQVCTCAQHIATHAMVINFPLRWDHNVNTLDPVKKRLVPDERLESNPLVEN